MCLWKKSALYYFCLSFADIKMKRFDEAVADCTAAQRLSPNDEKAVSKALYHRSFALKELQRYEEVRIYFI